MSIEFNFDERAFEKAIEKEANAAVQEAARDGDRMFDSLHRRHSGKPVHEVLPYVRSALRRAGWSATDREMREYAELISAGTKIKMDPKRLQL